MKVVIQMNNSKKIEEEAKKNVEKVSGAMAQEGMPLTDEIKKKLYNCFIGKTTFEEERQKVIEKYRRIYG